MVKHTVTCTGDVSSLVVVDALIYLKVNSEKLKPKKSIQKYHYNTLSDMDFDSSCLMSILNNGNMYESRVLKDYLESKGLSIKNLLETCCQKLDEGTYHCTDSRSSRMSSSTRTCYLCAIKNFKDLVYLYRKDIPSDELPGT